MIVNETTTFLDGDTNAAAANAEALTTNPITIFPAQAFGNVTVTIVTAGNVTNPGGSPGIFCILFVGEGEGAGGGGGLLAVSLLSIAAKLPNGRQSARHATNSCRSRVINCDCTVLPTLRSHGPAFCNVCP